MNPLQEYPAAAQQTDQHAWFMVVALWIPNTRVAQDSLPAEVSGAQLFHRSLTCALESARVAFEASWVIVPALSRAVCGFIVPDRQAALETLAGELQKMDIASHWVIGTRDRAEGIYRTLAPEKPAFDLNLRMATACPLAPDGNITGEHPELTHVAASLKQNVADTLALYRRLGFLPPENPS